MPKIKLSDVGLRSLNAPANGTVDYWDAAFPSFGCRVSQGGAKTFVLKINNSRRAIGRYPIITLAEAKAEARRLLAEKTLGKIRPQSATWPQAIELFLEDKARSRRARTVNEYRRLLERHFPFKGQVADVTYAQLLTRLTRLQHVQSEYNHALTAAKVFFNWCRKRRYISDNPLFGLSPHRRPSRARVLTDDELKAIWDATEEPTTFNKLIRLALLTGQRRGELAQLQPPFIKDGICTIPPDLAKNGHEHSFPLGPLAIEHLIFEPFTDWGRAKQKLDGASGVGDWTIHDLRRTFATRLAEMAVAPHVIERLLNHVNGQISGVAAIYNRATYLPEMRLAIEKWEERVQQIIASPLQRVPRHSATTVTRRSHATTTRLEAGQRVRIA